VSPSWVLVVSAMVLVISSPSYSYGRMKKSSKNLDVYTKPAQSPWLTKDDVAKQLQFVNRPFSIADNACDLWTVEADGTPPDLPNWQVLLHNELYGPQEEHNENVKRKYFGFFPRDAAVS
jgi:hypothetical protein